MREGDTYPNIDWGYGMLDIKNIFDAFRDEKKLEKIRENIDQDENNIYIEFDKLRKNIVQDEYKEVIKGNLFFRIPKIDY